MTQQVAILVDKGGTGPESLQHLIKGLRRLDLDIEIRRIHSHQLLLEDRPSENHFGENRPKKVWQDSSLLIVPGGRDFVYHQSLKGEGARRIQEYVLSGGSYLGICAGAYFGCSEVQLGLGAHNIVRGKRQLRFFPGEASGPALGNVDYSFEGREHCEVISLQCDESLIGSGGSYAYYNSGAQFIQSPRCAKGAGWPWKSLATYRDERVEGQRVAIVECWPGSGYALLSGVHPEMQGAEFRAHDERSIELKRELQEHQADLDALFLSLLTRALDPPPKPSSIGSLS